MHPDSSRASAEYLASIIRESPTIIDAVGTPTTPDKLLTAREAAKLMSVSEKTLFTMTKRGDVTAVRIGRAVRYDPADLARWISKAKARRE